MFFDALAVALLLAQAPASPAPAPAPSAQACPVLAPLVGNAATLALSATAGQLVAVLLDATPGTGYVWTLSAPPGAEVAQQAGRAVAPGLARPGAPAQELWLFAVRGAGTTAFTFSYARPWEHVPPAKTVRFTLEVKAADPACGRRFRPSL